MKNRKNQKQERKPLKDLTLLDRFLFDTAMSDPKICQNILSIIFNDKEVPAIRIGIAEKTQEPYYDSRAYGWIYWLLMRIMLFMMRRSRLDWLSSSNM